MQRLFEANKHMATTMIRTMLQAQEQSLRTARRFAEVAIGEAESWQNEQQRWLGSGAAMLVGWQRVGTQLTRALLDQSREP